MTLRYNQYEIEEIRDEDGDVELVINGEESGIYLWNHEEPWVGIVMYEDEVDYYFRGATLLMVINYLRNYVGELSGRITIIHKRKTP